MHDGSLPTLEDVVDFYDGGGRPNPYLDHRLRPLELTPRERADLAAFLRALSGRIQEGPYLE
jgi:cytochrome c peroxidase